MSSDEADNGSSSSLKTGRPKRERKPKRATRRTASESDYEVSDEISHAFDLVPSTGDGYRWYDWPYRFLFWLLRGWRRKLIPRRLRVKINSAANWLQPFNEHERNAVWSRDSWQHNVFVPPDEHVNVAGLWGVEIFPPTELPALEKALSRNGWVQNRFSMPGEGNQETLSRARTSMGPRWWRLADLVTWDSTWFVPDGIRAKLPSEFNMIELRAIQVGPSLTAVVAEFTLTDTAATELDGEWHKEPEPALIRAKPRWRALDRQFATYRRVQMNRRKLHTSAREWLAQNIPGFFAG